MECIPNHRCRHLTWLKQFCQTVYASYYIITSHEKRYQINNFRWTVVLNSTSSRMHITCKLLYCVFVVVVLFPSIPCVVGNMSYPFLLPFQTFLRWLLIRGCLGQPSSDLFSVSLPIGASVTPLFVSHPHRPST